MFPGRADARASPDVGSHRSCPLRVCASGACPASRERVRVGCAGAEGRGATVQDMEPEKIDPSALKGWHVVEAGRRQAWPFLGLADPHSGREVRLYLDSTFSVVPGWRELRQHDDAVLPALDTLTALTVTDVRDVPGEAIGFEFERAVLTVAALPNELTSHSPWWIGSPSDTRP